MSVTAGTNGNRGENAGLHVATGGRADVVVVGGGLGGLATALYLRRAGKSVVLFERAEELGGRAGTIEREGFHMNLGPHALYAGGAGKRVLDELGVRYAGRFPRTHGYAVLRGKTYGFPSGAFSLLTTSLFGPKAKLEAARWLAALPGLDTTELDGISVRTWLDREIASAEVREFFEALFRLSTYANDPERFSAGVAVKQLQIAAGSNVLYLDGGWRTLVSGLAERAEEAGVRVVRDKGVERIERDETGAVRGVRFAGGSTESAQAVVVAAGPRVLASLLGGHAGDAEQPDPVEAACLDVALRTLPAPRVNFALGIDRPLYLSVHSETAALAPPGAALVHLAKYLPACKPHNAREDERELEAFLDLIQPGWRSVLVVRQFLPKMTVVQRSALAKDGGLRGRPASSVPGVRGLYVVGDWVGPEGWLVDGALASARRAAALVAAQSSLASRAA